MSIFLGDSDEPITLVVRFYKNFDTRKPSNIMKLHSTVGIMNKELPDMLGHSDLDMNNKQCIYFGYYDYEITNIARIFLKHNPENKLPKGCYGDYNILKNLVITGTIHSSVPITKGDLKYLSIDKKIFNNKTEQEADSRVEVKATPKRKTIVIKIKKDKSVEEHGTPKKKIKMKIKNNNASK